jgi:GAF domain-containing protein
VESLLGKSVLVVHDFISGGRPAGDALTAISEFATTALGTDMAGLTLNAREGRRSTVANTAPEVALLDQAQYDADRGPCVDAFRNREVNVIAHMDTDGRWPEFAAAAQRHQVLSSLSVPVVVGDRALGALNFYDHRPEHFDQEMIDLARLFAGQSAVVVAYLEQAETADGLSTAMVSRAVIEQAKGVVMASSGCSAEEAFDVLRTQSQAENRKLRDVAAEIVARQRKQRPLEH